MQYLLREQSVGKNVIRFIFVAGVHLILGAALIATLNRVPIKDISLPNVTLINPVRPPQPPQLEAPREIIKANLSTARSVVVPPIDFAIENPPIADPVFVVTMPFTPSENRELTPATGNSVALAPTPSKLGIACPNAAEVQGSLRYPSQAVRDGIEGDVMVRFVVSGAGEIKNVAIASSTNRIFNHAVTQAVQQFGCRGQGQDVLVEAPFTFRLK
jgi:periplasmic protein TonB